VTLATSPKQVTSSGSRFLDACRKANANDLTEEALVEQTVRLGFNNVIDAFHILGGTVDLPPPFFIDERSSLAGIRITDAFAKILEGTQAGNLESEAEARWRLVETAWRVGVHHALISVGDDSTGDPALIVDQSRRRQPVTGARSALSGYQKGHCFYCFTPYDLMGDVPPHVDHFFSLCP